MPISFKDNNGNEIEPEWRKEFGAKSNVKVSIYEESAGKKYKSEKHYNWFLCNKDNQDFKDKKKIMNQSYYRRKAERLTKNRVTRYHDSYPHARYNDALSRRFREFIHTFC